MLINSGNQMLAEVVPKSPTVGVFQLGREAMQGAGTVVFRNSADKASSLGEDH